jgi:hypothetical protein
MQLSEHKKKLVNIFMEKEILLSPEFVEQLKEATDEQIAAVIENKIPNSVIPVCLLVEIENLKRTRTRSAANNSSNQYVLKRMTYQEEDSDSSKSNNNSDIACNDVEPNFNEKDEEEVKNSEQKSVTRFMSNNLFDFNLNTPSTKFKSLMLASRLSEKRNFVETQPLRNDSSTEDNQQAESQEDENDQSKRLCSFGRNAKVTPQMMNSNITPKASTINTGNTTKETSSETRSTTDHSLFLVTNINNQESSPT